MAQFKPGDRVECHLKESIIVSPYKSYDESVTLEVIAQEGYGYYLYVPHYLIIKGSIKLDGMLAKQLKCLPNFIGENVIFIDSAFICKIIAKLEGLSCKRCKEFFFMAESNQSDGTLVCYSCRLNRYR